MAFGKRKRPISSKGKTGPGGAIGLMLFFGVFLAMGLGFTVFLGHSIYRAFDARDWPEVPCTVLESRVESHSDSDGTTYSVYIKYRYEVDGRPYTSDRYSFMGGSSSGRKGKQAFVDRHPPGARAVCYVNPGDPGEAVMHRGLSWGVLFILIPLVFVVIGGGGVFMGIRALVTGEEPAMPVSSRSASTESGSVVPTAGERMTRGPIVLKARKSPVTNLIVVIIIAAIWNGIICIPLFEIVEGIREGSPPYFLMLFISIFVLVGLGLLGGVVYCFLALFNPRPRVTVNTDALAPGEVLDVSWRMSGATRSIEHFGLYLEGKEEATYRRGTNTYTDKKVFCKLPLFETNQLAEMAAGSVAVAIPEGLMHSFKASNNKIEYALCARGAIRRWPDIAEEFAINLVPAGDAS